MRDNGLEYDFIGEFSNGGLAAICGKSKKWGLINSSGEEVLPCVYDNLWCLPEFFTLEKNGNLGLANAQGKIVLSCEYGDIVGDEGAGLEPLFRAKKGEKYGLISSTGDILAPLDFDDIDIFEDGLAKAEKDGKVGFLDINGRVAIPFKYCRASAFKGGIASAQKENKWYIVDKNGKTVAPK